MRASLSFVVSASREVWTVFLCCPVQCSGRIRFGFPSLPESDFMHLWKINFRAIVYFGIFFFCKINHFWKNKRGFETMSTYENFSAHWARMGLQNPIWIFTWNWDVCLLSTIYLHDIIFFAAFINRVFLCCPVQRLGQIQFGFPSLWDWVYAFIEN